jgi:hypothetical protein
MRPVCHILAFGKPQGQKVMECGEELVATYQLLRRWPGRARAAAEVEFYR